MSMKEETVAQHVSINGCPVSLTDRNLCTLLQQHGYTVEQRGIAIAINDEVIPRSEWRDVDVQPDDRLEIVHAVQGG